MLMTTNDETPRKGASMKQYRETMARLITADVLEKIGDAKAVWVCVDGDVHNIVLDDGEKMHYLEYTVRKKTA